MTRTKRIALSLVLTFAVAAPAVAAKPGKDGPPGARKQVLLSIINPGKTNFRALLPGWMQRGKDVQQKTPGFRTADPPKQAP